MTEGYRRGRALRFLALGAERAAERLWALIPKVGGRLPAELHPLDVLGWCRACRTMSCAEMEADRYRARRGLPRCPSHWARAAGECELCAAEQAVHNQQGRD